MKRSAQEGAFLHRHGISFHLHMAMEMSVRSMKSNSVSGIMAEYPDIVTYRKTSLEKISPQLSFCSIKLSLFHSIFLLIAVVKSPFCHFFLKNCGEIFSNVVFLLVLIGSYPAMMPVSQLDFMLLTDISKVVWLSLGIGLLSFS